MTLVGASVTVWVGAQGIPERFVWDGERYRVSDSPTPLECDFAAVAHPSGMPLGWRFQGTNESGETRMFDVLYDDRSREWRLLHTYR